MMLRILFGLELFAAALLLIRFLIAMPMRVKGSSMQPTLKNGQWMIVLRTRHLCRGDVIICHYPGRHMKQCRFLKQYFVKRLIGMPGDHIMILGVQVIINGMQVNESYIHPPRFVNSTMRREWKLGPDQYFVMGDNRGASNDSRRIGPISSRMLVGKVIHPGINCMPQMTPWEEPV